MTVEEIADALASQLLLQPRYDDIQGTKTLKPLSVKLFAQICCALEAGDFYNRHLYRCPQFASWIDHLIFTAKKAADAGPGMFLEFGVASGRTISAIAEATGRQVYGFDSFEGLPEDWRDGAPAGAFASRIPSVPANVALRIGMIEQELPKLLAQDDQEIRFIHVDTDLYSAAKFILESCVSRMNDTIIVFDEFYNYPGWRDHEHKAWTEFQEAHSGVFDVEYVALGGEAAISARVKRRLPTG